METRKLILVDMMDRPVGTGEKGEVHAKGLLHRAFSLFLQDQEGRVLLQQRAMGKYHSSGLWTNSCCSHPAPGDSWERCITLRTQEELGSQSMACGRWGNLSTIGTSETGCRNLSWIIFGWGRLQARQSQTRKRQWRCAG